jgi:hypothetical protein
MEERRANHGIPTLGFNSDGAKNQWYGGNIGETMERVNAGCGEGYTSN